MKRFLALLLCLCLCLAPVASARDLSFAESLADDLNFLGLFRGVSETEYDLGRAPTRTEALVMLIRTLGKEQEALNGSWNHPFTDVAAWADSYVGYAWENGLTKGVSETQFGTANATCQQYVTFILRALGYDDAAGDFSWNDPYELARSCAILPGIVDHHDFLRADVVIISYAALPAYLKNSQTTLAQKLVSAGVFTQDEYNAVYRPTAIGEANRPVILSAEEVYAQCAPAVFYIEVYDAAGNATGSGSGFFITADGTAVTNFHVIDGAHSAKVTVSDTGKTYDVTGVWDCSEESDWAVIQVDGTGFSSLPMADSSAVAGGQTVYAIGSPLGLQNSITQGIISNTNRVENGVRYLQTSAAISSGSSGGALINEYGHVVGITSASYVDGQNLNLALPISVVQGYSRQSLTTLAALNAVVYERAELVSLLAAWSRAAANDTLAYYPAWSAADVTSGGDQWKFSLYAAAETSVSGRFEYVFQSGAVSTAYLTLTAETADCRLTYYYYDNASAPAAAKAAGTVTPSAWVEDGSAAFAQYEGGDADLAYYQQDAGSSVDIILSYLDAILKAYPDIFGTADITSLGFPALKE